MLRHLKKKKTLAIYTLFQGFFTFEDVEVKILQFQE